MPGVLRPYTLADVLGAMNSQVQGAQQTELLSGVGSFAEADETVVLADSATGGHAAPAAWDAGVWGATQWS
jgi:hypothetical protein